MLLIFFFWFSAFVSKPLDWSSPIIYISTVFIGLILFLLINQNCYYSEKVIWKEGARERKKNERKKIDIFGNFLSGKKRFVSFSSLVHLIERYRKEIDWNKIIKMIVMLRKKQMVFISIENRSLIDSLYSMISFFFCFKNIWVKKKLLTFHSQISSKNLSNLYCINFKIISIRFKNYS